MINQCWLGKSIEYGNLSGKEQESFNSAKLKSIMANWGYLEAFNVNGDKWGADLLFYRSSDGNVLKVQLKGRPVLNRHYCEKEVYVAFEDKNTCKWYVYPHDKVMNDILSTGRLVGTKSWDLKGGWSWSYCPPWLEKILEPWEVTHK